MIRVSHLTKHYGQIHAVDDLNFEIGAGEVVGFLGPNGAGKSTTMNILTGYLSATHGTVEVDEVDILDDPMHARRKIGYLPETPPLYPEMTVREYLRFVAEIKGVAKTTRKEQVDRQMETVGADEVADRLVGNLSKGYRQRVGLAQALMGNPSVLILDEPTSGLDPRQIIEIRELIREIGKDRTVVLSSHILPEVSAIARRLMIIHQGRIVADGSPQGLAGEYFGEGAILVTVEATSDAVRAALRPVSGVAAVDVVRSGDADCVDATVRSTAGRDIRREVYAALAKANLPVLEMRSQSMSLEDLFLRLTSEEQEVSA